MIFSIHCIQAWIYIGAIGAMAPGTESQGGHSHKREKEKYIFEESKKYENFLLKQSIAVCRCIQKYCHLNADDPYAISF